MSSSATATQNSKLNTFNLFKVVTELLAEARVAQLAKRLDLDLADTFPRDAELLADLLERAAVAVFQAEAQLEDAALALGQLVEHLLDLLAQHLVARGVRGCQHLGVLDEVTKLAVLLLAHRRLERHRLQRGLADGADLLDRDAHDLGQLLVAGLAAKLLEHAAALAHQPVDRLDHVDGNADGAGLVGDRAGDRLADPPGRVGRELEALAVVELLGGAHEAERALLDQVEEGE